MTLTATAIFLYGSGFTALGTVSGWLANHRLASDRATRDRRGACVGYLSRWRSKIGRFSHSSDVFVAFREGVHDFHLELGKIREDYAGDAAFIGTADALGALTENEIIRDGLAGRIPIFTLLDKLASLT